MTTTGADSPAGEEFSATSGRRTSRPSSFTAQLMSSSVWSDATVANAGCTVVDVPVVSLGGGIGSFVLADLLRIAGVPRSEIRVLGVNEEPWQNYQYLTRVSQIPEQERLRSDAGSTPDNIWAFPSYAVREAWNHRGSRLQMGPLWNVLTEPLLRDYYTPEAGQVFRAMRRESARIGYADMLDRGFVRGVRRRAGGGYFTLLAPLGEASAGLLTAYRSRFVHVAVGHPGIKLLPDLQAYRERYDDRLRVVSAYEPHEHVYERLRRKPATAVVRGSGIVASRILQRLIDDRERHGTQTVILHLFRTYIDGAHGPSRFMRRRGADGWAHQGFNWPKATWGGQLKVRVEQSEGENRKRLLDVMGGTTTPRRKSWRQQLQRGRAQGYYRVVVGEIDSIEPGLDSSVRVRLRTRDGRHDIDVAVVIDATGLEANVREHRVIADLLDFSHAGLNPLGRLDVARTFEVRGTRNGSGRVYATGAATLGGYYAPVDTFLGLQYAALQVCDDLARQGFGRRIGNLRSVVSWWRWARNTSI